MIIYNVSSLKNFDQALHIFQGALISTISMLFWKKRKDFDLVRNLMHFFFKVRLNNSIKREPGYHTIEHEWNISRWINLVIVDAGTVAVIVVVFDFDVAIADVVGVAFIVLVEAIAAPVDDFVAAVGVFNMFEFQHG